MNEFWIGAIVVALWINLIIICSFVSGNVTTFICDFFDKRGKQNRLTAALVDEVKKNHGSKATVVIVTSDYEIMVAPKTKVETKNG